MIPAQVRSNITRNFGAEGERWLASLPARVAELEARWSLGAIEPLDVDGHTAWVATCTRANGTEAVLKVICPHGESRYEADALRAYDGRGAVRLLEVSEDGFSLLVERCRPGHTLWALPVDEGNSVIAGLLRRLRRTPITESRFVSLADVVEDWCRRMPLEAPQEGYDPDLVQTAVGLGRELIASSPPEAVLLHNDLHPGNVLAAEREPWLVIDPKPMIGDPAFDLAQLLLNRCDVADCAQELRRQTDHLGAETGLDGDRISAWAVVKAIGWKCGPHRAALLDAARQLRIRS